MAQAQVTGHTNNHKSLIPTRDRRRGKVHFTACYRTLKQNDAHSRQSFFTLRDSYTKRNLALIRSPRTQLPVPFMHRKPTHVDNRGLNHDG